MLLEKRKVHVLRGRRQLGPSTIRSLDLYSNPPRLSVSGAHLYILTLVSRTGRFQHLHCGWLTPLVSQGFV